MSKMKKLLSVLVVLLMVFTTLPIAVSAESSGPNATVTELEPMTLEANSYMCWPSGDDTIDRKLDMVVKFAANDTLEECLAGGYSDWLCDFNLKFTGIENGVSFEADNCYLAGNYGSFGWIVIPTDDLVIEEGVTYPVVAAYDATLNYKDICNSVKEFIAAIHIDPAILNANPDLKVELSLKMTNPEDSTDTLIVGEPLVYGSSDLRKVPNAIVTELEPFTLTAEEHDYMCWPNGDATIDRKLDMVVKFAANDTLEECLAGGYSDWLCDFNLKFTGIENGVSFEADNCYLAGNYGSFGWIVIPTDDLVIEEGVTYPVVAAYDASLNYKDICNSVKEFIAAIHIDPAILNANPDLKVELSLKMTNPEDSTDTLIIGEPLVYDSSDLRKVPNAIVTELEPFTLTAEEHEYMCWPNGDATIDRPLDMILNFKTNDTVEDAIAGGYSDWICDFYLTVTGTADGTITADNCYLAGNYGTFGWIVIPTDGLVIEEGVENPVVAVYDAKLTYKEICDSVKDFTAAIHIDEAILAANPDLKIELALKMKNPVVEDDFLTIGEPAVYEAAAFRNVAKIGDVEYKTLDAAVAAANADDTITLIADVKLVTSLVINKSVTLDLGGKKLTTIGDVVTAIRITGDASVIVKNGEMDTASYCFILGAADGSSTGNLTIESGKYHGATTVASVTKGTLTVNGGEFSVEPYNGSYTYLLNCIDANYKDGSAKIVVTGGTFYNFNPEDNAAEGANTNFCELGYRAEFTGDSYVVKSAIDENGVFNIYNKDDLIFFAKLANAGMTFSGKTVALKADIDFGWDEWTPVNFAGTFDGGNHTIKNLTYVANASGRMGFFQSLSGSAKDLTIDSVKGTAPTGAFIGGVARYLSGNANNVHVKNLTIDAPNGINWGFGGFAGYVSESGYATNCSVENVTLTAVDKNNYQPCIGGFIGSNRNGNTFVNCDVINFKATVSNAYGVGLAGFCPHTQIGWYNPKFVDCDVTNIDLTVSGIADVAGFVTYPGAHTNATDCDVTGKIDVTGVTSDNCFAGGFFGNLGWNADLGYMGHVVTNCTADVDIITKVAAAGGFVGSATNSQNASMYATFNNCSASGDITAVAEGTADIGGFAGDADRGVYNNCSASGTVTNNGTGYSGQFVGALYDVTPKYDGRYPAGTRDYPVDEITVDDCSYTGTSTELKFIGNTADGVDVEIIEYVAEIDGVKYQTLAEAIAAVKNGETIVLIDDCAENVTITQKKDISFTINGADKTYTGTISIKGRSASAPESLTIKNVNFLAEDIVSIQTVKSSYARNITIENCNFDGTGYYPIVLQHCYNITIKDCESNGTFSEMVYGKFAITNLVVENVTVKNSAMGFALSYPNGVTFKNVNIDATGSAGVYLRNNNANTATFENCTISAATPIILSQTTKNTYTLAFNGTNNLTSTNGGALVNLGGTAAIVKVIINDTDLDVDGIDTVVAKIGNVHYNTLKAAIDAAADGDVITVVSDVNLDVDDADILDGAYYTFAKVEGKSVTIDLNGKNLYGDATGMDKWLVGFFSATQNGHLVINDSVGTATVKVEANGATVYSLFSSYDDDCSIEINGGSYSLDVAKDCLIHSSASDCVTVNDGNFYLGNVGTGDNGQPWIINVNGRNDGHVNVNGGTFNADINHQHWAFEVDMPETLALRNNGDGTWTVVDAVAYTGEVYGEYTKFVGYATLEEAIAAADAGETVTLLTNIQLDSSIVIANDKDVVLDLNGKIILATDKNTSGNFNLFVNKGTFTVKDSVGNGAIFLTAMNNRGWLSSSTIISNEGGDLTIESGTLKHLGGSSMAYAIDNNSTLGETNLTVNGGVIESTYRAIRAFQNNKTQQNNIVINGGTISGRASIWMQQSGKDSLGTLTINDGNIAGVANAVVIDIHSGAKTNVTINGGSFSNTVTTANLLLIWPLSSMSTVTSTNEATFTITGGTFNCAGKGNLIGLLDGADATAEVDISGGIFSEPVAQENCADGYVPADLGNGTYSVKLPTYVAKIGDTMFETLESAMRAATPGATVVLLTDIDDTSRGSTIVNAGVTLDLNGFVLKAGNLLSFGDIIDTAATAGGVEISNDASKAFTMLQVNNTYMPIYDTANGMYRFFAYTFASGKGKDFYNDVTGTLTYGYKLSFTNSQAYEILAESADSISLVLDLTVDEQTFTYTCDSAIIKNYAKTIVAGNTGRVITFTATGVNDYDAGTVITATANIVSATKFVATGKTIEFTK